MDYIDAEVFEDMLKKHDWYYKMSDSMKVYDKGEAQEIAIKRACKGNDELTKMYEDYKAKMGL